MKLPVLPPLEPMLATSVPQIPTGEGMSYEPKWDGYRCIVFRDGDEVELASRGGKMLTRYFPDVVAQARAQLPERSAIDGELVVIRQDAQPFPKLDFGLLGQRIHPAASRVKLLAEQTPASFIAFDLVALDDEAYLDTPYPRRRELLEQVLAGVRPPVHVTPITHDPTVARHWFHALEGAGLDGVIAKPADLPYVPGKRLMYKIKHARTADCVVAGFRWHKSGPVIGSLLLGLFDDAGVLHHVGVSGSFSRERRAELVDELAPYRENAAVGHPWLDEPVSDEAQRRPGAPSRWSSGKKDPEWQPLRPELVVEVGYDAMEGERFRHPVQFLRWRPDREARSCTYAQLERPVRIDVATVLAGQV